MKKLLSVLLAISVVPLASANHTVFSCFMKNGKHLSVQKIGNDFQYSYGRAGKPEMVFRNKASSVEAFCGTGDCSLSMSNKGVDYGIWGSYRGRTGGGITVTKNGKVLADTACDTNREIYIDGNYFN